MGIDPHLEGNSGLVEETDERPDPKVDDERRRYYRLTGFGERVLDAEVVRMRKLARTADAKRLVGRRQLGIEGG